MSNLKEIRSRIASVKSTQQITSAMKMVSAAKLRRSQGAIVKLRPYSKRMSEIMSKVGSAVSSDMPLARKEKDLQNVLLVALTSNKGLCSVFNSSIIKLTKQRIDYYKDLGKNIFLVSYGKKGDSAFRKLNGINYIGTNDDIWDSLTFKQTNIEADKLIKAFQEKKYDKIEIIYNQFKNAATQIPTIENFLPVEQSEDENKQIEKQTQLASEQKKKYLNDYIFSPSKQEIVDNVIPQSLKTQFYKCFLDSFTSEHGARMSSMNKATDNAQELLKELTLTYNKRRQADITNQIIEVSNGANAI